MDVTKITEKDWEKYKRMRKIARGTDYMTLSTLLFMILSITTISLLLGILIITTMNYNAIQGNTLGVVNYTGSQIKNLSPSLFNFIENNLTSSLSSSQITNITNNAKVIHILAIFTYVKLALMVSIITRLIVLIILLIVIIVFIILTRPSLTPLPSSYKEFQRRLAYYETCKARLLAAHYTEADIKWYLEFFATIQEV